MITALVLAAGVSQRMGSPKMLLPWGKGTVLGRVLEVLQAAGISDALVVSGGARASVEQIAAAAGARVVFNPEYAAQEMLSSLQAGLRAMQANSDAALITLGDQPQIGESTIRSIVTEYSNTLAPLIVPSYRMRRGHPWLLGRPLWEAALRLRPPETPRDFLSRHASDITYIEIDSPTILQDLDTPEDYLKSRSERT